MNCGIVWRVVENDVSKLKGPVRIVLGFVKLSWSAYKMYLSGSGVVFGRCNIIFPYSMISSIFDRLYWCHSGHHRDVESALCLSFGCLKKNVI